MYFTPIHKNGYITNIISVSKSQQHPEIPIMYKAFNTVV